MQEVKIYTASPSDLSPPVQSESFCVDMVLASDYAELEAKCAALAAKLSMINDLMEAAEQANKLAQEATETLVQERNALAAENAALKSALNDILQPDAAVLERNHRVRALDAMETPATDAFLAEVRASAQSEVIEWVDAEITAIDTMYRGDPSYEHDAYWMKSNVLDVVELARKAFVAQLRKGAAL
ncbi:hypothetical protein EB259_14650 [Salmonella enterica]|nr:hypothetical protein [Salmonella enterica]EBE4964602.1 hypothetical protein [Salmonella enterica]EBT5331757.1 hypothetical protein [Salmonella enterica]ECH4619085.1 hypothetical protein [Salmonella enterica]EGG9186745.1 hypothetical protein [Salmonella enterica]